MPVEQQGPVATGPEGAEAVAAAQTAALAGAEGLDRAVATVVAWARTAPDGLVELHLGRWAADRRSKLRLLAARTLTLAGRDAGSALIALLADDPSPVVRRHVAAAFVDTADLGRPDDLARLAALVREPDDVLGEDLAERLVARVAAWEPATGPGDDGRVPPELLAPLLDGGAAGRRAAVMRGLGRWRPGSPLPLPDVTARLTRGLGDEDPAVGQAAAEALAGLTATLPAQGWALVRRLHAEGGPNRRALLERHCVAGALARGMPRDEAWTWATAPGARTRLAIALALARADPGRGWHRDLLRHLCVDPAPTVRAAALDAARAYAAEAWAARAARRGRDARNRVVAEAAARLAKAVRARA